MIIHLLTALALAVCPQRSSPETLDTVIQLAERSFQELNPEGFESATGAAYEVLECVNRQLPPNLAARFHRLRALEWFSIGNSTAVLEAYRASVVIEPEFTLPTTLVPIRHPLRRSYEDALEAKGDPQVSILAPQTGALIIDGTQAQSVPNSRPYIFQHILDNGKAALTSQVSTGGLPPAYTPQSTTSTTSSVPVRVAVAHTSRTLAISSGVAALVGGTVYALAAGRSKQFHNLGTDYSELSTLKQQTNSLAVLSGALGGAALGTGLSALVVGNW